MKSTSGGKHRRINALHQKSRAISRLENLSIFVSTPAASTNLRSTSSVSELRLAGHPSRLIRRRLPTVAFGEGGLALWTPGLIVDRLQTRDAILHRLNLLRGMSLPTQVLAHNP